jgi:hypothetical protein
MRFAIPACGSSIVALRAKNAVTPSASWAVIAEQQIAHLQSYNALIRLPRKRKVIRHGMI